MIIATAGHVDHGKTTLVRALTGVETDRLPEERARGMTIDLGFAYLPLPAQGTTLGFVDVPGHERFVRNMLAGVAGIDHALLVIAADDGPMPQTLEHLAILDLLGIRQGTVALTKVDRVPPARVAEVTAAITGLLAGTALAGSPVFPTAALGGLGVPALQAHLTDLVEARAARAEDGYFRLAIDRCFVLEGAGRVVTGTVYSGAASVGDSLIIAPRGLEVRVRSLHVQNENAQRAVRGDRCGINLTGADLRRHDIHRGDWLVAPQLSEATQRLGVRLRVAASETRVLRDNTPVHLHLGASDIGARVGLPSGTSMAPGEEALVQLTLEAPALAVQGDRFVIRDQAASRTLGGGAVLEAVLFPARLSRVKRLPLWRALDTPEPVAALRALVEAEPEGVSVSWFARNSNRPEREVLELAREAALEVLVSSSGVKLMLAHARILHLLDTVLESLAAHHAAEPERTGLPEQELPKVLPGKTGAEVLRVLTDRLVREARVLRRSGHLCLPNHTPTLAAADERLLARVTAELERHGRQAPALHDMPTAMNLTIEVLKPFMERMARLGYLHHVGRYRYYLPETLRELALLAEALALESPEQRFSAADYKQHTGIGRNVTIEVLEYFDRIGLTRRFGQVRMLRRSAAEALGT